MPRSYLLNLMIALAAAIGGNSAVAKDTADSFLHLAGSGTPESVAAALDKDPAHITAKSPIGWTALHYAADKNNHSVVEVLVKRGGDVNAPDAVNSSPLHAAAHSGAAEAVKELLRLGAKVDVPIPTRSLGRTSPLDIASGRGFDKIVESLLEAGAAIEPRKDQPGRLKSALYWACHGATCSQERFQIDPSNREVIKLLVKHGGSLKSISFDNHTPFDDACDFGALPTVAYLLEAHRKELRVEGEPGKPSHPLVAVLHSEYIKDNKTRRDIVALLLKHGCKPSAYELSIAEKLNDKELLEVLGK